MKIRVNPDSDCLTSLELGLRSDCSSGIIRKLTDAWLEKDFDVRAQALLNRELRKHSGSCAPGVRLRNGKPEVWLVAYDTYGACLVQLVEVFTKQTRVYLCDWCGEPGVRGPTEKRHRKYCSDAHRLRAYRARRKEDA